MRCVGDIFFLNAFAMQILLVDVLLVLLDKSLGRLESLHVN